MDLALRHSAAFEHRTGAIPGLPYGERGLAENVYLNVAVGLRRLPIGAVLPATCIRHYREVSDDGHVGGCFGQVEFVVAEIFRRNRKGAIDYSLVVPVPGKFLNAFREWIAAGREPQEHCK